jgi:hypothetical protein
VEQQHEVWQQSGSDGCDLVVVELGWKGEKHQILLMVTGRHQESLPVLTVLVQKV